MSSVVWRNGQPYGKCGNITWNCQYDSNDPQCCQYVDRVAQKKKARLRLDKEALDKEYGPEIH